MPLNKTSIKDLIRQELEKKTSLPVLSPDAINIQSKALKKDPHFSNLAGRIRKDPTLTGEILKTANSPFYQGTAEVETLKDALIRLGQTEMVNIIMAKVHLKNFTSATPLIRHYQDRLWAHSVACATGSLYTARHLSLKEVIPKAFIAGLLHDMGKLLILAALEGIMHGSPENYRPDPEAIETIHTDLHLDLGYALLNKWQLPEQYAIIALDHHKTDLSDPLGIIVMLSNTLCICLEERQGTPDEKEILNSKEARSLALDESWSNGFKDVLVV